MSAHRKGDVVRRLATRMIPGRASAHLRVRRPATRLLLGLYAIGIATAVGISGSWYYTHSFVRTNWPAGTALAFEVMGDAPDAWAAGKLQAKLDRISRFTKASVYDTQGALVGTNVQPPFAPPTPIEERQAAVGMAQRGGARAVRQVRLRDAVFGYAVFEPALPSPPFWGVMMDLLIISTWISAVGLLVWRTLVRPLQRIADAAEAFGQGNMLARTGVVRRDEIGMVARAFDEMSERIALSREAERELLAGLSHELRTPLARIRVALDLAEEGDAATARASLADVAEELVELETLMASIFSTTRLALAAAGRDNQRVPLQRAEVDLPALVEKAVMHLRGQHPERPYNLEAVAGPAERCIYADGVLIRRAIENVLENAHKYSPAGAPVTVTVGQDRGAFRIAISDRGFGICPADLPRVFTPFFRADRSRTRATGGVGLGLALAKRVVDAHDGSISVSSQVDAGTTVTFLLPIADVPRDQLDQVESA